MLEFLQNLKFCWKMLIKKFYINFNTKSLKLNLFSEIFADNKSILLNISQRREGMPKVVSKFSRFILGVLIYRHFQTNLYIHIYECIDAMLKLNHNNYFNELEINISFELAVL